MDSFDWKKKKKKENVSKSSACRQISNICKEIKFIVIRARFSYKLVTFVWFMKRV